MVSEQEIDRFSAALDTIRGQIAKEIVGQTEVVNQLLITLVAGGNALLEGVPGLGKTRLVRTLSHVFSLPFSRIQFTPDLMPADITGTNIFVKTEAGGAFQFQEGPLFSSIVLADEINRATPKTQAALLEAMQEHAVTVAGVTRTLPEPYFVLATQNPVEQEGTYPLPEAQLDRFLMKILVPFPSLDELKQIVLMTTGETQQEAQTVSSGEALLSLRAAAREVPVAQAVLLRALTLVQSTHPELPDAPECAKKYLRFGASPRAAQAIISAARVRALMCGRFNVAFEDLAFVAPACLRHRIALNFEGISDGKTTDQIISLLLAAAEKKPC
jgi:MoxR-like ATPase